MRSSNTDKTFFKFKSFDQFRKIAVNTSNLFTQSSFTIVSESNNDEIFFESVIFSDNVVFFQMSSRNKFAIATFQKKFRKRKNFVMINVDDIENSKKIRALDRVIRWNIFFYFINDLWIEILHDVYDKDINIDSYETVQIRAKIFDNIKIYKNRVLERMKIDNVLRL